MIGLPFPRGEAVMWDIIWFTLGIVGPFIMVLWELISIAQSSRRAEELLRDMNSRLGRINSSLDFIRALLRDISTNMK